MHKIQKRPMVIGGKIEVRLMMYLALSYYLRLIDGKEAVTFFFFQAEGGIRDKLVTGVQTCALPICPRVQRDGNMKNKRHICTALRFCAHLGRSDERRVGKECRSRWSPYN